MSYILLLQTLSRSGLPVTGYVIPPQQALLISNEKLQERLRNSKHTLVDGYLRNYEHSQGEVCAS